MKHLSGNVVSLKAFVPDISDQTAYAVSKAMARYPEDRYESYAEFIEQLEDAKRRITDPEFPRKAEAGCRRSSAWPGRAKYKLWLIMAAWSRSCCCMGGLVIWKGSALLHQKQRRCASEI